MLDLVSSIFIFYIIISLLEIVCSVRAKHEYLPNKVLRY